MRDITSRGTARRPALRVSRVYIPGKMNGWVAQYSLSGQTYRKFYSAGRYGTSDGARTAALADIAKFQVERDEFTALRRRLLRRKNNRTGIPGLFYSPSKPQRGAFWVAFWTDEAGKKRQRKFSESSYGADGARRHATDMRAKMVRDDLARLKGLAELLGVDLDHAKLVDPDEF